MKCKKCKKEFTGSGSYCPSCESRSKKKKTSKEGNRLLDLHLDLEDFEPSEVFSDDFDHPKDQRKGDATVKKNADPKEGTQTKTKTDNNRLADRISKIERPVKEEVLTTASQKNDSDLEPKKQIQFYQNKGPVEAHNPKAKNKKKHSKKFNLLLGLVGVLVLVLVVCALLIYKRAGKQAISLNDYVATEFSGYQGYGVATAQINYVALEQLLTGEAFVVPADEDNASLLDGALKSSKFHDLYASIQCEYSQNNNLSNGDVVVLTITYDTALAKKLKVDFTASAQTLKIVNLSETRTIDPFENLKVSYSGTSPKATLQLEKPASDGLYEALTYESSKTTNIAKGDKITITVLAPDDKTLLEKYGCTLASNEKSFTCDDVDTYLLSAEEFTDKIQGALQSSAMDALQQYAKSIKTKASTKDFTYAGHYFLTSKNQKKTKDANQCYILYSTTISSKTGSFSPTKVYLPVLFSNIVLHADGSTNASVLHPSICGSCSLSSGSGKLKGYTNYATMKNQLTAGKTEQFKLTVLEIKEEQAEKSDKSEKTDQKKDEADTPATKAPKDESPVVTPVPATKAPKPTKTPLVNPDPDNIKIVD